MHPEIVRDKPGVCPICNMHLVKKQNKNKINYEHNHNLLSKEKNKSLEINNDSGIISNISLYDLKLMNVEKKVKALGKIVHNQEKVYRISSLYEGRIEKLYFNFEGQKLNKGDKILEIYSPDIASAQKEYKQIYNYYNNLKINKSDKDILDLTKITLDAIERKLTILGLNKNQINNIIFNKDTDYFNVPIYSSKSGIIMRKNVEIGQYIKSGEVLFEIVDHSKLWLEADIYESDIKDINLNQVVNININSLAKNIKGKISFIDNTINPKTNTLKVRINVDNYDYTLKPNMISSIDILLKYKNVIAIPKSSLVINGNKNIVWVKKADNIYEPKEVKVNFETDDYYVISSGLSIKDKIVQNGAFLLDSESKISLDNKN
jgi:Cu(I)/Ag(I) efflux system membrane fusion protein